MVFLAAVTRISVAGLVIKTSTLAVPLPWPGSNPDHTKLLTP